MKNNKKKTKYDIIVTTKFNKELKKSFKQGKNIEKLKNIIEKLANGEKLEEKYKDHALQNTKFYRNCRECHVEPDWLLIYKYNHNELLLFLVEIGTHSNLFNM